MSPSSLQDMIKDTDGQSDEETHRVRSGRVLSTEAPISYSWGASPTWCGFVHQPGGSPNSVLLGFYGGFFTQA